MTRPATALERQHHEERRVQLEMSDDVLHYLFWRETGTGDDDPEYEQRFDDWFNDLYEAAK